MSYPWGSTITDAITRLASYYNGSDYNASTNPGGFGHGGHTTNFIPALQDDALVANAIADAADYANTAAVAAAASAVTAAAAATALIGTSTTSVAIGTGSKSFTTQSGKSFSAGTPVIIYSAANPTLNYMGGLVSAYSGTSLTVSVTGIGGSGTFTDWTIAVAGLPGAAGASGATGATGPSAGLELAFGNGTTDSDPGNGIFKMSSGTFASITTLYFDNLDRFGNDISAIFDTFDDTGKSTDRGRLIVVQISAPAKRMVFIVTGSVVDGTGYRKISVTPVGTGTIPTNAENCTVQFVPTGAAGSDGVGSGTVIADSTSISGNIPIYSDTTGNHIEDSLVGIGTSGAVVPRLDAANTWSSGQLQTFAGGLKGNWYPGAETAITAASTTNIGTAATNNILINGTTTITSFGTTADQVRFVRFSGILTLTHNSTSLILPGAANITTAAGATCIAVSDDSGNWRVFAFQRANGKAVVASASTDITDATTVGKALIVAADAAAGRTAIGAGTATGPGSATDNALVRFDSTTGALLQNSEITLGDSDGKLSRTAGISIQGTNTNDNAAAGYVGQLIESDVPSASGVGVSTGTSTDITLIALSPGDWDVFGSVATVLAGGASVAAVWGWFNTTSITIPSGTGKGGFVRQAVTPIIDNFILPVGTMRISVSVTTNVYLSGLVNFSGGSMKMYGYIAARRVR